MKANGAFSFDIALQGGGAHGAFAWGVLDRLLDEARIDIVGVSGASAGAMNAVVLAHGLLEGGRAGAKKALAAFWRKIGEEACRAAPVATLLGAKGPDHLPAWLDAAPWLSPTTPLKVYNAIVSEIFSPYQLNPFNINPLLSILRDTVAFDALRATQDVRVFVSATRVRDGSIKIFRNAELSAEAVMASATLPELFQAVEIDGEAYWDGGYSANPPLEPLIAECRADDLLFVQLNPKSRDADLRTSRQIANRLNEIMMNMSLKLQLRYIAKLKCAVSNGGGARSDDEFLRNLENLRLHAIAVDEVDFAIERESKLDATTGSLHRMHKLGVESAEEWLSTNGRKIGEASTFDYHTAG